MSTTSDSYIQLKQYVEGQDWYIQLKQDVQRECSQYRAVYYESDGRVKPYFLKALDSYKDKGLAGYSVPGHGTSMALFVQSGSELDLKYDILITELISLINSAQTTEHRAVPEHFVKQLTDKSRLVLKED